MGQQVQRQRPKGVSSAKIKAKSSTNPGNKSKFVGVRQRPSGKWVAEIKDTTKKIRMWLGTFETAEEAARAYDEAACLLRGSNTRTNFATPVFTNSHISLKIRNLLNHKRSLKQSSPSTTTSTGSNTTAPIKPSTIVCDNNSSLGSSNSSNDSFLSNNSYDSFIYQGMKQDGLIFDDAYRPDLSSCIGDFEASSSTQFYHSWPFPAGLDPLPLAQEGIQLPNKHAVAAFFPEQFDIELSEFEHMKVERQISASLYTMNGLNQHLENAFDPSHALWDLPTMSQSSFLFSQCYEF